MCGSRDLGSPHEILNDLDHLIVAHGADAITIVHGGAKGADQLAGHYADQLDLAVEVHFADWDKYKKAAGPIRNAAMLATGIDAVYAYVSKPLAESIGTSHMVSIARRAGVQVQIRECW